jgi:hypothetical protein
LRDDAFQVALNSTAKLREASIDRGAAARKKLLAHGHGKPRAKRRDIREPRYTGKLADGLEDARFLSLDRSSGRRECRAKLLSCLPHPVRW